MCANALQTDWATVLAPKQCCFILGNSPFLGKSNQSAAQKADMQLVCGEIKNAGLLDFVAAWYIKAARYLKNNAQIKCAFVSTNSITQGEQVGVLWAWMLAHGVKIHFAHRTFSLNNEARGKAAVHCVIIGFGLQDIADKVIYEYEDINGDPHAVKAGNINPYLLDSPDLILDKSRKPICNVPEMTYGSMANDGGFLLLSDNEKKEHLIKDPTAEKWIKKFVMGDELLNNISRWCLWLVEIEPNQLRNLPEVLRRVEQVRAIRIKSTRDATKELANLPNLFGEIKQPKSQYLALPRISSEIIAGDKVYTVEGATIFHFGIFTSTMHIAWMRFTSGRMKSDYSYTNQITYNNFPWPEPTEKQTENFESCAQAVLDERAARPNDSLADLYDPLTMPANLLKAHQALD